MPHLVPLSAGLLLLLTPPFPNASLKLLPGVPGGPSLSFCTAERSSGVEAPVLPAAAGLDPSASSYRGWNKVQQRMRHTNGSLSGWLGSLLLRGWPPPPPPTGVGISLRSTGICGKGIHVKARWMGSRLAERLRDIHCTCQVYEAHSHVSAVSMSVCTADKETGQCAAHTHYKEGNTYSREAKQYMETAMCVVPAPAIPWT
jgi:hypothetical protein